MPGTVVDRVRDRAKAFPGSVAIIQEETSERVLTYAELFDRVDRLSHALAALGLQKGDGLLAFMPNTHEAVECELAALQSGLAWVTLTARLTWSEVRGVIVACAPKLVVTTPDGVAKIEAGLRELPLEPMPRIVVAAHPGGEVPTTKVVKQTPTPRAATDLDYEELLSAHRPIRSSLDVDGEDVARLRYTSGTTGGAKAAVLPHRVYHASLDNLLHALAPVTADDRALHVAPLTHGSGALLYPVLYAGGVNVLEAHFDAEAVLASLERHGITTLFTVPTMLSRLVASPRFEERDLSRLRALIYGGAPMPAAQLDVAVRKIGRALYQIYGMTEAPWPICWLGPEDHRIGNPRLRSVGRASSVCEVRIASAGSRGGVEAEHPPHPEPAAKPRRNDTIGLGRPDHDRQARPRATEPLGEARRPLSVRLEATRDRSAKRNGNEPPAESPTESPVGEIQVRGRNVMREYLADEAGTRAVLHDGWLRTGDLGRIDEDGYVFIVGRAKDVIISGGFNVYAAEVEAALSAHEGVLEAAVVGLPHDDWGELVAAVVVPKPGASVTAPEIDALARHRLSGYKCPRRIEVWDDLPKNASGKIQKSEIVGRLLAGPAPI